MTFKYIGNFILVRMKYDSLKINIHTISFQLLPIFFCLLKSLNYVKNVKLNNNHKCETHDGKLIFVKPYNTQAICIETPIQISDYRKIKLPLCAFNYTFDNPSKVWQIPDTRIDTHTHIHLYRVVKRRWDTLP